MNKFLVFTFLIFQLPLICQIEIDSSIIQEYYSLKGKEDKQIIQRLEYMETSSPMPGLGASFVSHLTIDTINNSQLAVPSYLDLGNIEFSNFMASSIIKNDTVVIDIVELFGYTGVRIKIADDSYSVNYSEFSEDEVYKESLHDKAKKEIRVPVTESKLILAKEQLTLGDEVFGMVYFKTAPYYYKAMYIEPHINLTKTYRIFFKCTIVEDWR